ncbi:Med2p KNAG_0K01510 [Huiozyma naganishii CBS 8797]|uniref:Uncharacterized protein n=1 Tax=Huiozyma naganishii (strain ATCC MYA-139 / BCRC 22969 / CBS 8797 / KCTC 17520 / NBRC 10181 / NCYC 3082 / Yp74L-3) TaxID=1071383 RepID=J7S3C1_HUIN7|nr:hypothetical protein KNAG_0K01510 [Kazachstania naganishii CBS 8797]CCK72512.1 hypothetical protein KNAG_0K01510 [Kazachstania naganishii CBS 8797]
MTEQNKLTRCFDDILRLSSEMLVQQQLKTIQLDTVNGFTQDHQKVLSEKIHSFHGILDEVDVTLLNAVRFVEKFDAVSKEKELERVKQREREAQITAEEEARKKRELKLEQQQQQQHQLEQEQQELERMRKEEQERSNKKDESAGFTQSSTDLDLMGELKMDFDNSDPTSLLSTFGDVGGPIDLSGPSNTDMTSTQTSDNYKQESKRDADNSKNNPSNISDNTADFLLETNPSELNNKNNNDNTNSELPQNKQPAAREPQNTMFNDLDSMDMSLFAELDNPKFGASSLETPPMGNNANSGEANAESRNLGNSFEGNNNNDTINDSNTNNINNTNNNNDKMKDSNGDTNALDPSSMDPLQDNGDDYLTLNDFNDLNIDWNANPNDTTDIFNI